MASAAAKSLRSRAACALLQQLGDQAVDHCGQLLINPALPGTTVGIQPQDHQHAEDLASRAQQ